jgi:cell wall-associated NlpC family hydrolase
LSRRRTLVASILVVAGCLLPAADVAAAKRIFGSRPLQQGSVGRDVRVLQDFLTRWGVTTPIDGVYGPVTAGRVRAWERLTQRRINGRMSLRDARELRRAVEAGEYRPDRARPAAPATEEASAAPAATATLGPDGKAIPPPGAPEAVVRVIAAANQIHDKPYKYGGGHGRWNDTGYDCSGSMSYAFHGAGMLRTALDSSGFMRWGKPGPGRWITTYAHGGHSYMVVAGLRFDTSGRAHDNSRWDTEMRSSSGYTVRHPPGL